MLDNINIRIMKKEDYDGVSALWNSIKGFGIRSIDDSKERIEAFIDRNPNTSVVAEYNDEIVGAILCGHDGRRGSFYHVCVRENMRRNGIGKAMAVMAMRTLQEEGINYVSLNAYKNNEVGNLFWNKEGYALRDDFNTYDFILNEDNITKFIS